jgi:gluconolactonase
MPANNYLPDVLETTEAERLATGFIFTEGPLWHPGGYWYFVDIRQNKLFRLTPGKEPEVVRNTIGGNGTTFDLQGRLVVCGGMIGASWGCRRFTPPGDTLLTRRH